MRTKIDFSGQVVEITRPPAPTNGFVPVGDLAEPLRTSPYEPSDRSIKVMLGYSDAAGLDCVAWTVIGDFFVQRRQCMTESGAPGLAVRRAAQVVKFVKFEASAAVTHSPHNALEITSCR
jgi:hypothetical protein